MSKSTLRRRERSPVKQFSVFADNKVGRLNEMVRILGANDVHVMALCSVDTTDTTIIRFVFDYPEAAIALLEEYTLAFNVTDVIAVELDTEADIQRVTCALTSAEINIHYIYPMLTRPRGRSGLILHLEDNDLATDVLRQAQLRVIDQSDIAR